jgi:hypothetical protein
MARVEYSPTAKKVKYVAPMYNQYGQGSYMPRVNSGNPGTTTGTWVNGRYIPKWSPAVGPSAPYPGETAYLASVDYYRRNQTTTPLPTYPATGGYNPYGYSGGGRRGGGGGGYSTSDNTPNWLTNMLMWRI